MTGTEIGYQLENKGERDGRGRDRTAGFYRVKVVPALYPHGSSLSQLMKSNQTSPHLGAIGQKLGRRATCYEGPVRPYALVPEHRTGGP